MIVSLVVYGVLIGGAVLGFGAFVSLLYGVAAWLAPLPPAPRRLDVVIRLLVEAESGQRPLLRAAWQDGPASWLAWAMPVGITLTELDKHRELIEQAVNCALDIWFEDGLFVTRAYHGRIPRTVTFAEVCEVVPPAGEVVFPVGVGRMGLIWADLAALPHLLVGGQTGGGKTAFLRQLVTYLVRRLPPERLMLGLVDLKGGMDLNVFSGLPHLLGPVACAREECGALLEALNRELDRRKAAFNLAGAVDLAGWNRGHPTQALPYLVLVVDELAELTAVEATDRGERASRQAQLAALSRLVRLGRACGVHVIGATQRPDAEAVPGLIKANMPATVAFRVRDGVNSRILLGDRSPAAAGLPPFPGRAVWQWDVETEMQASWLSREEAEYLLRQAPSPGRSGGTEPVTRCPQTPRGGVGAVAA